MPNEDKICLPSCQSKTEIYTMYKEDMEEADIGCISWSSFKRMWITRFKKVIIPKVSGLQTTFKTKNINVANLS